MRMRTADSGRIRVRHKPVTVLSTTAPQTLTEGLGIPHQCDADLGPLTWYGIGGRAKVLASPTDTRQFTELIAHCRDAAVPVRILGRGANLLVADSGVEGVVVRLDHPVFKQLSIDRDTIIAGGGFDLAKLVLQSAKAGRAGLECLAGVPATVGGAIRMNAGGAFGEIGAAVERVRVCDADGTVRDVDQQGMAFGYRTSAASAAYILEAEFRTNPDDPARLVDRVKEIFLSKKDSQPLGDASAGCAFKNPVCPDDPPQGCTPDTHGRLSAGQLIDLAGLKGYSIGGAEVSTRHANFIVAHHGCSATDIVALVDYAAHVVHDRFGITLEREMVVWP